MNVVEMGGGVSKWILGRLGAAAAQIDFKYPAKGGSRVEVYQIWCQPARISNVKRGIDLSKTLPSRTTHRCYKLVAPAQLTFLRRSLRGVASRAAGFA